MLGSEKAYAHPTVVTSHNDLAILRNTMRVIRRPKTLKPKGFRLKGCPNCDLKLLTMASKARLIHHVAEVRQGMPISLCGAELEVRDPVRSATLGGVDILDGTYCGVTVAHAFTEIEQASKDKTDTNVVFYDSDWADSSSEDESVGYSDAREREYWSPTSSVSTAYKKTYRPATATISSNRPLIRHDMGDFSVAVISSQCPLRDVDNICDDVDRDLIKISNPIYHCTNRKFTDDGKQSWLASSSLRNYAPRSSVLTATRKGTVRGLGTGSTGLAVAKVGHNYCILISSPQDPDFPTQNFRPCKTSAFERKMRFLSAAVMKAASTMASISPGYSKGGL